jgi:hypothetical protein
MVASATASAAYPPTSFRPATHLQMPCTQGVLLRLDLLLALSPLLSLLPATTKTQQAGVGRQMEAGTAFPLPSWAGGRGWGEWVREVRVAACARGPNDDGRLVRF